MAANRADDLVLFRDVRVIRSTAPALFCRIGDRSVWLPRRHISGKLLCRGDRGRLFIRLWVARDRHLVDLHGVVLPSLTPSFSPSHTPCHLRLVRRHLDMTLDN